MNNSYSLHPLELAEYTRILPTQSGISACMYIDESNSYKRWQHPMWVIVSEGDPYFDRWFAISVDMNAQILMVANSNTEEECMPSYIQECREFVGKFYPIIATIADEEMDSDIFYEILSKTNWRNLTHRTQIIIEDK